MKFIIKEEDNKKRIDKFLVENLSDWSRSRLQKVIKNNQIVVNGKPIRTNYKIKVGDEVLLKEGDNTSTEKIPKKIYSKFKLEDIRIIKETSEYLVINKPAGLVVHGGKGVKEFTLVDLLLEKYPQFAKVGEDPDRPGIIHRLDKEVSGLMV